MDKPSINNSAGTNKDATAISLQETWMPNAKEYVSTNTGTVSAQLKDHTEIPPLRYAQSERMVLNEKT